MRIFVFTWNTQSVRMSETVQRSSHEPMSIISDMWYQCQDPDFLPELVEKAIASDSEILVFSLQESAKPGDYFLSHAVHKELGNRYILLCRQKMIGVGKVSYTSLKRNWEVKFRGVRIAVFVRLDFLENVELIGDTWIPCPGRERFTHGKGAVAVVVRLYEKHTIAFVNMHLPFDCTTLKGSNLLRVEKGVSVQNHAFNSILEEVSRAYPFVNYWLVMGDMNYRIFHREGEINARKIHTVLQLSEEQRQQLYKLRDELKSSIDVGSLPPFEEGVDGNGPSFMPTAKMVHHRTAGNTSTESYCFGEGNHINPSWTDRILYSSSSHLQGTKENTFLKCIAYNRFEEGKTMTLSDHSAIIGTFELKF